MKKFITSAIAKYGHVIAACAFVFLAFSANSACAFPFYEPDEPVGIAKFKKFTA